VLIICFVPVFLSSHFIRLTTAFALCSVALFFASFLQLTLVRKQEWEQLWQSCKKYFVRAAIGESRHRRIQHNIIIINYVCTAAYVELCRVAFILFRKSYERNNGVIIASGGQIPFPRREI
jgi:CBS domain containing-hemolysin-like protein